MTARGARTLHKKSQKTVLASRRVWPVTPHAVVATLASGRAVSERVLDAGTLVRALKAGAHIWVGHLGPDGTGHAVAVRSFAPTERVVLLSDGLATDEA